MRKILIADPELHYLLKLQTKFFQKLQDSYEIEIISDKNYFERVFSSPQNADCLIINEGWFDSRLEKHNIEHIVLLSDELVSLGAKSADISSGLKIPRHTSIEEIFNQVRNFIKPTGGTSKLSSSIIMFKSATGGTGKTTLALALAEYLADKYYNVLYMNTQTFQTFNYYLQNRSFIPSSVAIQLQDDNVDVYSVLKKFITKNKFYVLPPFGMLLYSYGLKSSIYTNFIKGAKKEFDYIIIDGNNDVDADTAAQMALTDKIFLVTLPGENYLFALKQMLRVIQTDKVVKICNKASMKEPYVDEFISVFPEEINSETISKFAKTNDIKRLSLQLN